MKDRDWIDSLVRIAPQDRYQRSDLLIQDLLVTTEGQLRVFYAPFDYTSPKARIVLVGVTPGWTQMEAAVRSFLTTIASGGTTQAAFGAVKRAGAFSGSLRANLVSMLDDIGMAASLGIGTCDDLFGSSADLCHPTSAIRYPVFRGDKNYAGTSPALIKSPTLVSFVDSLLLDELTSTPSAMVLPLGVAATSAVDRLVLAGEITGDRVLSGFPHPSGANAHRIKQFTARRDAMTKAVARWSDQS
jgi:hypothetical protein